MSDKTTRLLAAKTPDRVTWRSEAMGFIPPIEWIMIDCRDAETHQKLWIEGWQQKASGGKWLTFARPLPITKREKLEAIWKVMRHLVPPPATIHERNQMINDAWMSACGGREEARICP